MTEVSNEVTARRDAPLLSVVIPTRNRMATLEHSIANVLAAGDDLEVVVHDTSDDPAAWAEVAARIGPEPRLRYHYTAPPQSFAETFDKAVSFARGRCVTIIGDDDGILPQLLDCTRMADAAGWEALTPSTPAAYNWPDFRHLYYGDADAGRLSVRPFTGPWEPVDVARELDRTARGGFQDFGRLPRIYYGVVRRDRLEALRHRAGAFFVGTSPDISGAVGLATVVERLVSLDFPVFLPGSSANSGAGRSGMKKHVGSLRRPRRPRPSPTPGPPRSRPFYAVQTVWAQAALATLDATRRAQRPLAVRHGAVARQSPRAQPRAPRDHPGQSAPQREAAAPTPSSGCVGTLQRRDRARGARPCPGARLPGGQAGLLPARPHPVGPVGHRGGRICAAGLPHPCGSAAAAHRPACRQLNQLSGGLTCSE